MGIPPSRDSEESNALIYIYQRSKILFFHFDYIVYGVVAGEQDCSHRRLVFALAVLSVPLCVCEVVGVVVLLCCCVGDPPVIPQQRNVLCSYR